MKDYLAAFDREADSDICHYGVPGMKWGVRKAEEGSPDKYTSRRAPSKNAQVDKIIDDGKAAGFDTVQKRAQHYLDYMKDGSKWGKTPDSEGIREAARTIVGKDSDNWRHRLNDKAVDFYGELNDSFERHAKAAAETGSEDEERIALDYFTKMEKARGLMYTEGPTTSRERLSEGVGITLGVGNSVVTTGKQLSTAIDASRNPVHKPDVIRGPGGKVLGKWERPVSPSRYNVANGVTGTDISGKVGRMNDNLRINKPGLSDPEGLGKFGPKAINIPAEKAPAPGLGSSIAETAAPIAGAYLAVRAGQMGKRAIDYHGKVAGTLLDHEIHQQLLAARSRVRKKD